MERILNGGDLPCLYEARNPSTGCEVTAAPLCIGRAALCGRRAAAES